MTTTTLYTGLVPITGPITTTIPPVSDTPGTVLIETPPGTVTTTRAYTGPGVITQPIFTTIPAVGGQSGTVIVETPASITPSAPPSSTTATFTPALTDLPPCASNCVTGVGFGPCSLGDVSCFCRTPQLLNAYADCIDDACSPADGESTYQQRPESFLFSANTLT